MGYNKAKNAPKGFIAIVALGIFMLLALFGVMVATVSNDTILSIKNANNYYAAKDAADSVMEYLQFQLNGKGSGFSIENKKCTFGNYIDKYNPEIAADGVPGGAANNANPLINNDDPYCIEIGSLLGLSEKNALVEMEIKGKSTNDETYSSCPGILGNCYVVPTPGGGNAGENCELFTNTYDNNDRIATPGGDKIAPLDHPCNWNKLLPGSSATDRVSIPFYHTLSVDSDQDGKLDIENPFNQEFLGDNEIGQFVLRMRTPCADGEEVCTDADRMVLDDIDDNVVVQWQMSGMCPVTKLNANGVTVNVLNEDSTVRMKECGLIQNYDAAHAGTLNNSAIFESVVNRGLVDIAAKKAVIQSGSASVSTDSNLSSDTPFLSEYLLKMDQPTLTLFLSDKLVNKADPNGKDPNLKIKYLEYQLLSNQKIADPKVTMDVTIDIDGNIFKKTLYQNEQKPLVDFAVQN